MSCSADILGPPPPPPEDVLRPADATEVDEDEGGGGRCDLDGDRALLPPVGILLRCVGFGAGCGRGGGSGRLSFADSCGAVEAGRPRVTAAAAAAAVILASIEPLATAVIGLEEPVTLEDTDRPVPVPVP